MHVRPTNKWESNIVIADGKKSFSNLIS